jgi:hypothetical protein
MVLKDNPKMNAPPVIDVMTAKPNMTRGMHSLCIFSHPDPGEL